MHVFKINDASIVTFLGKQSWILKKNLNSSTSLIYLFLLIYKKYFYQ